MRLRLAGRIGDTAMAQLIPVSQHPGHFVSRTILALQSSVLTMSSQDRFVELADAFFSGRYAESHKGELLLHTQRVYTALQLARRIIGPRGSHSQAV